MEYGKFVTLFYFCGYLSLYRKVTPEEKTKIPASKLAKLSTYKPAKSISDSRSAKSSADARIDELDQKWSDRFNRLEALLLARMLDKRKPTFQTVKVMPLTHMLAL